MKDFAKKFDEFDFFESDRDYTPKADDSSIVVLYEGYANLIVMFDEWEKPYDLKQGDNLNWRFAHIPQDNDFDYNLEEKDFVQDRFEGIMLYADAEKFLEFIGYKKTFHETVDIKSVEIAGWSFGNNGAYGEKWVKKSTKEKLILKNKGEIYNEK